MSSYTLQEFHNAGIEPQECDGIGYTTERPTFWHACDYHSGYIDGYEDAQAQIEAEATDDL